MTEARRGPQRRPRVLHFTKMHGLGNDFVVIDLLSQHVHINEKLVVRLADRRFGIGCDQVLVVEAPRDPDVDFRYRIYNADGAEVEQCGNGARCFARFVRMKNLTNKKQIKVQTLGGVLNLVCLDHGRVRVDMGSPALAPALIPFAAAAAKTVYTLNVAGTRLELAALSMGNPHAVLLTDDVDSAPLETMGPQIQRHEAFPNGVNVGFMEIISRTQIRLRVFERGAGETLACGTGACAAVVSGILRGLLEPEVNVALRGGTLHIHWPGADQSVMMTGPATFVFEGQIRI